MRHNLPLEKSNPRGNNKASDKGKKVAQRRIEQARTRIITIWSLPDWLEIPERGVVERAVGIPGVDCAGQGHRCPDNENRHVLPTFLLIH